MSVVCDGRLDQRPKHRLLAMQVELAGRIHLFFSVSHIFLTSQDMKIDRTD